MFLLLACAQNNDVFLYMYEFHPNILPKLNHVTLKLYKEAFNQTPSSNKSRDNIQNHAHLPAVY